MTLEHYRRQVSHVLLVNMLVLDQLIKNLLSFLVSDSKFDLILMESVSVEEFFVALNADESAARFISIVARVRPRLLTACLAISLCAVLAKF